MFGDAGMANRTLFPRAFGLRTPASLWTAPALDRCLLLALVYPVATIFVIWAVTGHVGPAEAALHLKPTLSGWQRGIGVALVGFSTFALWHFFRKSPWKFSWVLVAFVSGVIAVAIAGTVTIAVPLVVAFAGPIAVMFADTLVEMLADSGKVVGKVTGAVGAGLVAGFCHWR